jgi:hypothetical protein
MDASGFVEAALHWLSELGTAPLLVEANNTAGTVIGRFGLLLIASVALVTVLVRRRRAGW